MVVIEALQLFEFSFLFKKEKLVFVIWHIFHRMQQYVLFYAPIWPIYIYIQILAFYA